jgi:hypothetical protein
VLAGLFSLALLAIGVESIAATVNRNKRCSRGVRRGKYGGCTDCIAEKERLKASQAVYARKRAIKKEATALRNAELRDLTTRLLSKSELYRQMYFAAI